jgi:L-amino acid N-acyltransferase YncA
MRIDPLRPSDWGDVRRIFLEGIASGNATFETRPRTGRPGTARTAPTRG